MLPQNKKLTVPIDNENYVRTNAFSIFRFIIGFVLTLLVLIISFDIWSIANKNLLQLLLATPVVFLIGVPCIKDSLNGLLKFRIKLSFLVTLSSFTAYFSSIISFLNPEFMSKSGLANNVYFDVASIIMMIYYCGKILEEYFDFKNNNKINNFKKLIPKTARLLVNGNETIISALELGTGSEFNIEIDEIIPVDGMVIDGITDIDESIISGKSEPVRKKVGDRIIAGSINKSSKIQARANCDGNETLLNQIVSLVEKKQQRKLSISRLIDSVAFTYFIMVIIITIGLYIYWSKTASITNSIGTISNLISLFIILSPCALLLAVMFPISIANLTCLKAGIIIRSIDSFRKANKLKAIAFDKSGTLTMGKPSVIKILPIGLYSEERLIRLAASAEIHSDHPIATAIKNKAESKGIQIDEPDYFFIHDSYGIEATLDNKKILVGNLKLMEEFDIDISPIEESLDEYTKKGNTPAIVAVNGRIAGLINLADRIKPDTNSAIQQLKKLKLTLIMMTGENEVVSSGIATQLGIDAIMAEVQAEEKLNAIESIQNEEKIIGMVGSNFYDAQAIAKSVVGFVIQSNSTITQESGDFSLQKHGLEGVAKAISISRKTMRAIRQNVILSVIFNLLCIPFLLGFINLPNIQFNPGFALYVYGISCVAILLNSFRLVKI